MTPEQQLSQLLKDHISKHGHLNAVTTATNVCKGQLLKYVDMTGSPRINTAERIFEYFGYELKIEKK